MRFLPRVFLLCLLSVTVAASSSGCRKRSSAAGGGLKVKTAAEARAASLAVITAPSFDRSFERVGAIARELSLPFDLSALKAQALAATALPPQVVSSLDTGGPMSLVVLPPTAPGQKPQVIVAISAKSVDAGKQIVSAMGKPFERREDAAGFKTAEGTTVWLWQRDNKLVAGDTVDSLIAGAALALESQRAGDDDVVATVYPEAIARSQGTDVKSAMAKLIEEMNKVPASAGQTAESKMVAQAVMMPILQRVADTEEAQMVVRVDAKRGGSIGLKMRPKAGSAFAKDAATTAPYALSSAVMVEDPMMVGASSAMPFMTSMWSSLSAALTPSNPDLVKLFGPVMASFTGAGSWSARSVNKRWQQVGIYDLAQGASPQAYLDVLATALSSPAIPKLYQAMGTGVKITTKRDKDLLLGEMKLSFTKVPAEQAAIMKSMVGDKLEFAVTARDGHLFVAVGPDSKGRLAALSSTPSAPAAAATGDLAEALQETRGADTFMYMDLMKAVMGAVSATLGAGKQDATAPFAQIHLPMWFTARGGQTASYEWRIPMSSIRSVGSLVPIIMMMGQGGMGQGGMGQGAPDLQ